MTPPPLSLRLGASALVLLLLTGCGGSAASSGAAPSSPDAAAQTSAGAELRGERAVVERVVDGDTVDVRLAGEVVRVRLLNIDTPETKDPNEVVECLGPEATALLEELLPPGTVVGLEYDEERTDSYGRTLAGVFRQDGTLVNAEIARRGLGTPLYIAPNDRFLPPVEEAFAEAEQQRNGLLDPAQGCTVPAQLQQATSALAGAEPADLADPAGEVAAAAAFLAALDAVDGDAHPHVRHLLGLASLRNGIAGARQDVAALQERAAEQRRAAEAAGLSARRPRTGGGRRRPTLLSARSPPGRPSWPARRRRHGKQLPMPRAGRSRPHRLPPLRPHPRRPRPRRPRRSPLRNRAPTSSTRPLPATTPTSPATPARGATRRAGSSSRPAEPAGSSSHEIPGTDRLHRSRPVGDCRSTEPRRIMGSSTTSTLWHLDGEGTDMAIHELLSCRDTRWAVTVPHTDHGPGGGSGE